MTSGKETTSIHTTSYDQLSNSSTSDRQSDVGEENNCNTSGKTNLIKTFLNFLSRENFKAFIIISNYM